MGDRVGSYQRVPGEARGPLATPASGVGVELRRDAVVRPPPPSRPAAKRAEPQAARACGGGQHHTRLPIGPRSSSKSPSIGLQASWRRAPPCTPGRAWSVASHGRERKPERTTPAPLAGLPSAQTATSPWPFSLSPNPLAGEVSRAGARQAMRVVGRARGAWPAAPEHAVVPQRQECIRRVSTVGRATPSPAAASPRAVATSDRRGHRGAGQRGWLSSGAPGVLIRRLRVHRASARACRCALVPSIRERQTIEMHYTPANGPRRRALGAGERRAAGTLSGLRRAVRPPAGRTVEGRRWAGG
jgi:hypothetical protein